MAMFRMCAMVEVLMMVLMGLMKCKVGIGFQAIYSTLTL